MTPDSTTPDPTPADPTAADHITPGASVAAAELDQHAESGLAVPHVLPAPARQRRAGRNMVTATAVGVTLAVAVLASLFLQKQVFVGFVVVAVVAGAWELTTVLHKADVAAPFVPIAVGMASMEVAAYAGGPEALVVSLMIAVAALAAWRLLGPSSGFAKDLTASVFIVMYLGLLAGFAVLLVRPDDGPWRVVSFIVLVVCSDLGGFAVGVLFGRHPMSPTVSPKKSWEGFAGSVTACVVAGVVIVSVGFDGRDGGGGQWWQGALLGLAAVCSATLGDLAESMIKRDIGVKDMSNLLPGHGGVMDRLDSLVATAPVVWLLLTAFVPPL